MKEKLEKYIGTACEIKTMQNELLSYGRIIEVNEEETKISMQISPSISNDQLPLVKYNTPVKIMLHKDDDFMAIGATVFISDREYWKTTNIVEFQNFERRGYFRVSTVAPGEVIKEDESGNSISHIVQLIDISLSGVLFAADEKYREHDLLNFYSQIKDGETDPFQLKCRVVAVEETINHQFLYKYRCRFEEMDSNSADNLCKVIFKIERENIKKMKAKKGE